MWRRNCATIFSIRSSARSAGTWRTSAGLIQTKREVEIESRTEIGGRQKRADYLFRTEGHDRFVCEAKKPAEELHAGYAFQAKRYAWNKGLPLAILTDFEEFKIYIVGGRPYMDEPLAGLWKTWHFRELPLRGAGDLEPARPRQYRRRQH